MSRDAIEIAARAWADAVLDIPVIYANQAAPRPSGSYATVAKISDTKESATPYRMTTSTPGTVDPTLFVQKRIWQRRSIVRFDIYDEDPTRHVKALEYSPQDEATQTLLRTLGVTIFGLVAMVDESLVRDTSWDRRAVADFALRYFDNTTAEVDDIQTTNFPYTAHGG